MIYYIKGTHCRTSLTVSGTLTVHHAILSSAAMERSSKISRENVVTELGTGLKMMCQNSNPVGMLCQSYNILYFVMDNTTSLAVKISTYII